MAGCKISKFKIFNMTNTTCKIRVRKLCKIMQNELSTLIWQTDLVFEIKLHLMSSRFSYQMLKVGGVYEKLAIFKLN